MIGQVSERLPFVDAHERAVSASPERTWRAVQEYVVGLAGSRHVVLSRILRTSPRSGFAVVEEDPPRELTLAGHHRFATYRLTFQVTSGATGTRVRALTYAAFPGIKGRAYRAMVKLSTGHVRRRDGCCESSPTVPNATTAPSARRATHPATTVAPRAGSPFDL